MPKTLHRHLPHLPAFADQPVVFFTVVTHARAPFLDNAAKPVWQKDYFDRYLRSSDNYSEKWHMWKPIRCVPGW